MIDPGRLRRRQGRLCPLLGLLRTVLGFQRDPPVRPGHRAHGRALQGRLPRPGPRDQGRAPVLEPGGQERLRDAPELRDRPELHRPAHRSRRGPGRPAVGLAAVRRHPVEPAGQPGQADLRLHPGHVRQGPVHRSSSASATTTSSPRPTPSASPRSHRAGRTSTRTTSMTALANYIPSLSVDPIDPRYEWSTWSPRIGISWDLKGDGRTVLKLSLAQYGDVLAAGANTPGRSA
ncbi:MAG: hypothetical protein MZU84_01830 [Sphingobacterium sp.]|nr:hypothetical protein [Sphingobacterium sp.]